MPTNEADSSQDRKNRAEPIEGEVDDRSETEGAPKGAAETEAAPTEETDEAAVVAATGSEEPEEATDGGDAATEEGTEAIAPRTGTEEVEPLATTAAATGAMTPGQRLAAARAKKAAKKTSERGREGDEREQMAIDRAEQAREAAGSYLETNGKAVAISLGVLVIALVGFLGVRSYRQGLEQEAGALLGQAHAIHLTRVEIDGAAEGGSPEDPAPHGSWQARADAALAKYDEIIDSYPSTDAAAWAHLGRGRALLEKQQPSEARAAYQQALRATDGDPGITRQALEGIGFSHEAEENWAEALSTYEELGTVQGSVFENWADYHAARMQLREGNEDGAKVRLQAIIERLDGENAPTMPYLRGQVEERLASIDASLVPRSAGREGGMGGLGGLGGGGQQQFTPEQIQELLRQAQAQQGDGP